MIDRNGTINKKIDNAISNTWTKRIWKTGEMCIFDNKFWLCKINNSQEPKDGVEWEQKTMSELLVYLMKKINEND